MITLGCSCPYCPFFSFFFLFFFHCSLSFVSNFTEIKTKWPPVIMWLFMYSFKQGFISGRQERERWECFRECVNEREYIYSCYCYFSVKVENICSHSKLILCFCQWWPYCFCTIPSVMNHKSVFLMLNNVIDYSFIVLKVVWLCFKGKAHLSLLSLYFCDQHGCVVPKGDSVIIYCSFFYLKGSINNVCKEIVSALSVLFDLRKTFWVRGKKKDDPL